MASSTVTAYHDQRHSANQKPAVDQAAADTSFSGVDASLELGGWDRNGGSGGYVVGELGKMGK